jgi:hypothetical protein
VTLHLFPWPRELELTGAGARADAPIERREVATLPAEGYEIAIDGSGVHVDYADENALRHAEDTLAQIRRQSPEGWPGLRLRDAPDFPVRGLMLDVSRDRVPTRETLERLIEVMALGRMNHLELYTEHAFAYRDHERVWRDASPMTSEDVRWLDGRCRDRGIELVANQNCFGHMGRWLALDAYRDRAEAPDGWEAPRVGRRAPAVLAPTEENARFALELVRELMASFTSRRVNIGCDETFELGHGRSRIEVATQGRGRVYLDHLMRLLEGLHADGCEVLFWGDILRSHPELVAELPRRDTVALAWHYEAPMAAADLPEDVLATMDGLGMGPEVLGGFAAQVPAFADAGVPFWVCPGTSSWNSLLGRWDNARRNLLDAAEVGRARGAQGFLITDWGDNGHLQPPSVSFAPLLYGAALAWSAEANRELDVARVLDERLFDDATGLGSVYLEVADAYARTGLSAFNASPLFAGLLSRSAHLLFGSLDPEATRALVDELDAASERAAAARPRCDDGALCVRELRQAIRLARHGAWRLLMMDGAPAPGDVHLRRDLAEAIEEQRACWLARSRSGGLEDSLARLSATLDTYG